jgi:hypothetical protein
MKRIISFVLSTFLIFTCFSGVAMGYYDDFNAGPSPVASWDFDEGRGDRTRCRGINGLDGRLFGAEWAKGVMGSALYFDGNAFVETPHDRALNNGRAISVEAWICPEDSGLYQRIITKTAGRAGEDYDYCLFSGDRENVGFAVKVGTVAYSVYSPAYSVPIGKWTHVIGVYNGRDIYIFLNGKEVARNQACGPMNDRGGHLRIGGDINPSQFNGRIDEVKIYNVALSGDDGIARYDESLRNKPYYNSDNYDNGYGYSYNYGYNNSYNNYKNNYGNYNYPVRSYRSWENDFDSQLNYFRHLREYFAHSRTWY